MRTTKLIHCGILSASLCCAALAGCDRTLYEKTKVKQDSDSTKVESERTVQHPDGSITTEKETSKTDRP